MGKPDTGSGSPDSATDLVGLYDHAVHERERLASLLAVTAHELRHPLHLMRLALARFFPRGDEHGREVMERYVDRMARVIGDVTDLMRLEQDALSLTVDWTDITRVLRDVVDAYRPDALAHRIKLTLEGASSPLWAQLDEQRLLQVLSNVLDNAIKFTPVDGTILVALVRYAQTIELRVRDSGRGIAAETLPRVFDLYATSASAPGMGVGLTVARRIVELHGGHIDVLSDGPDKGTEVVITLPIGAAAEQCGDTQVTARLRSTRSRNRA